MARVSLFVLALFIQDANNPTSPSAPDPESNAALETLIQLLDDANRDVRYTSFKIIVQSELEESEKREAVLKMMDDSYYRIVALAFSHADKLFEKNSEKKVKRLLQLVHSENKQTLKYTFTALAKHPKEASRQVAKLLGSDMLPQATKKELIQVVGRWEEQGAPCLPQLIRLIDDEELRTYAIYAIGNLRQAGKPALSSLSAIAIDEKSPARIKALQAMGQILNKPDSSPASLPSSSRISRSSSASRNAIDQYVTSVFTHFDSNRDGILSTSEATRARLEKWDTNKDGKVTKAELKSSLNERTRLPSR